LANSSLIEQNELTRIFLNNLKILDVRSESEYLKGAYPCSVNIPILSDHERHLVGSTYKYFGQTQAIELGEKLVADETRRSRVNAWQEQDVVAITCARGGLRSKITQQWLAEAGKSIPRISGGYKVIRSFFLEQINNTKLSYLIIAGKTGSRKTLFLQNMVGTHSILDLEQLANHRGSAFGGVCGEQPAQATFENHLGFKLLNLKNKAPDQLVLVESESRRIGNVLLPEALFLQMNLAPIVVIEAPLEERVQNIVEDYIVFLFNKYREIDDINLAHIKLRRFLEDRLLSISRHLGSERTNILLDLVSEATIQSEYKSLAEAHTPWITIILKDYYDKFYDSYLSLNKDRIIFSGRHEEILDSTFLSK
jgi:tRNA 2-selenouridine synthase